ncbi:lipoprotein [Streptomyces violaceusniger]|uniref:Lipoprotein n=2 Tax=Streptomyces violaceusniger TaxID=68280 RepID=A0A4D4L091_STRVO|nr:lipoprotein [Streptomyces violaceusniger]
MEFHLPLTKTTWLRVGAPVAVLALALTACGPFGEKGDTSENARHTSRSGVTDGHQSGAQKVGMRSDGEPPLRPGQAGTRAFKEDTGVEPTYRIAAQKVDIGTAAEAKALVSNPADAEGKVPAVAYVKYTHVRGATVKEYPRVGDYAEVYADGRRGAKVTGAAGRPKGCADSDEIKNWRSGQSYLLCNTFLVPARASSVEVMWTEIGGEPFVWTF